MNYIDELKHITPDIWKQAGVQLLEKMFAEFMYEYIIDPEIMQRDGDIGRYRLLLNEGIEYRFKAKQRMFDSYQIVKGSIERGVHGVFLTATQPIQFLLDIQKLIGMRPTTTGHLIKEYQHTLLADCHILLKKKNKQANLLEMDYAQIEGEMEGHPWITYNKGRIGFGYDDYLAYAPENKQEVKLTWLAVDKSIASFQVTSSLSYETLMLNELGEDLINHFKAILTEEHILLEDYLFIPVHEWQWNNLLIPLFAEDLALRKVIPLGEGADLYLPQQSIRTFVNMSSKHKHHVKLPMSILNTLVYRGLPGERTVIAPEITEYIQGICEQDRFLKEECRLILPGEVASIHVRHDYYEKLEDAPYQYIEMLGSIWRESLYSYLDEGEKAISLASLLYVDDQGRPFIGQLVERSGLSVQAWFEKFFNVIMPPLLHYLYQYGTVFSPHGQNTIVVLKNNQPHRLAIKDFVDDVNISDQPLTELEVLSDELKKVLRSEPPEGLCQFIFTGLFICHLRYLSNILEDHYQYEENKFWGQLLQAIINYQTRFPELQDRFELFNMLKPEMTKLCLNRNRMLDYGYEDDGERPHASEYGKVKNALYEVHRLRQTVTYVDIQYKKVVTVRPVSYEKDLEIIYKWMHEEHLAPFWKLDVSLNEFQNYLKKSLEAEHKDIYIASLDDEPVCYFMTYKVSEDQIRNYYDVEEGDLGGHFAIGKRENLRKEVMIPLLRGLLSFGFYRYDTKHIIVEPDIRNRIVIPTLKQCGFEIHSYIQLPHKKAALMILRKEQFEKQMSELKKITNGIDAYAY
ncbi:GNAT family N-acetyltransferase [Chengkuizengella sediminis]|nr:GNAT family N-acetyltransferase [Chengkuizengella sediminis]